MSSKTFHFLIFLSILHHILPVRLESYQRVVLFRFENSLVILILHPRCLFVVYVLLSYQIKLNASLPSTEGLL
jgi:hypothetical protein